MKVPKFTFIRMVTFILAYIGSIFAWGILFPFLIGSGFSLFLTIPFFFCWVVIVYCAVICLCFGFGVSTETKMFPIALAALPIAILSMYCAYGIARQFWHYPEFWKTVLQG